MLWLLQLWGSCQGRPVQRVKLRPQLRRYDAEWLLLYTLIL